MSRLPHSKICLIGASVLGVGLLGSTLYLMPHRIEREIPHFHLHLVTYAKWGRVVKEELVDKQGRTAAIREFPSWFVPLYKYRQTGQMPAEKTFYFDPPGAEHWDKCVTYIDQKTMVVQLDTDQDGVVDSCQCQPAEWGM